MGTFNRDDCKCGADHDTIESIVHQTMSLARSGQVHWSDNEFAEYVAAAAAHVGWTK